MKDTIGLIGGMGPEVTTHFLELIHALEKGRTDQERTPLVVLNETSVPDRTAHIIDEAPSFLPAITEAINRLRKLGVKQYAILCFTAHYYRTAYGRIAGIDFIDLIQLTLAALEESKEESYILLATRGTIAGGVFPEKAGSTKIQVPEPTVQEAINRLIYRIKRGDDKTMATRRLEGLLEENQLHETPLILGCSELSMLDSYLRKDINRFNPLQVLAETIVGYHDGVE